MAAEAMKYKNGTLWKADWPFCHTVLLQVLPGPKFCLLSFCGRAAHGGTGLSVISEENGKWQYDYEDLEERLRYWSPLPNKSLKAMPNDGVTT